MECEVCGSPLPRRPVVGDGHAFCCFGCRTAYMLLGTKAFSAPAPASAPAGRPGRTAEAFLKIDGMHCASCEVLMQRIGSRLPGIVSVSARYAAATAKVVYDADRLGEQDLPRLLSRAGYRARLAADASPAQDERGPVLRLVTAAGLGGLVMMLYLAFFYPLHLGLASEQDYEPIAWLAFRVVPTLVFVLATVLVFAVGSPILRGAAIGLRTGVLNMDNLLAIAILAAYAYSVARLLAGARDLYFDVAAAIVTIVTIGRFCEQGARAQATRELTRIMKRWRPVARVLRDGELREEPVNRLRPGEVLVVAQGEAVPVDGVVVGGEAALDESLMTGEPFPVARQPGQEVLGGSLVIEGSIQMEIGRTVTSRAGELSRILWNLQSCGAGTHGFADRVAQGFVPAVLALAAVVAGLSHWAGRAPDATLLAGLATLIVSCPCTFGLAIPLTTATALASGLRRGIIVTRPDAFTKAPRFRTAAIDKTGTLSTGRMAVLTTYGTAEAIACAAAVERLSSHPIARAIARLDDSRTAVDLAIYPGKGAGGRVDGRQVVVGSRSLIAELKWQVPEAAASWAADSAPADAVISYVGWEGRVHGAIITRDDSRHEWRQVIDRLRRRSRVVLLTGAEQAGEFRERVDEVFTGVPPEGKADVVRRLREQGAVLMIGDGSNDAPALAAADLGIAFGTPTALAAEAAGVVIPGDRLGRVFEALDLIAIVHRRVRQNLGWALLYNAAAIPLAVCGLINPLVAAVAMSTSSLLVVWNSTRAMRIQGPSFTLPPKRSRGGASDA